MDPSFPALVEDVQKSLQSLMKDSTVDADWTLSKKKSKSTKINIGIFENLKILKIKMKNNSKNFLTLAGIELGSPRMAVGSADHSATRPLFFFKIFILMIKMDDAHSALRLERAKKPSELD